MTFYIASCSGTEQNQSPCTVMFRVHRSSYAGSERPLLVFSSVVPSIISYKLLLDDARQRFFTVSSWSWVSRHWCVPHLYYTAPACWGPTSPPPAVEINSAGVQIISSSSSSSSSSSTLCAFFTTSSRSAGPRTSSFFCFQNNYEWSHAHPELYTFPSSCWRRSSPS